MFFFLELNNAFSVGAHSFLLSLQVLDFFYFPCACDINELAYTLMLRKALYGEVFPSINALIEAVCYMSKTSSSIPMLSRTNGQTATATATTLGKEMANFAVRLKC